MPTPPFDNRYASIAYDYEGHKPCVSYSRFDGEYFYADYGCYEFWPDRPFTEELGIMVTDSPVPFDLFPHTSLAFNPANHQPGIGVIGFSGGPGGATYVMFVTQTPGGPWTAEIIETFGPLFYEPEHRISLAYKSDGTPCVAYAKPWGPGIEDFNLFYACQVSFNDWEIESVGRTYPDTFLEQSLAFDPDDNPHILHTRFMGEPGEKIVSKKIGGNWTHDTIPGGIGFPGWWSDLAFDPNGNPHAVYVFNYDCTAVMYSTDTGGGYSMPISLSAPFDCFSEDLGYPSISFYNGLPHVLMSMDAGSSIFYNWFDGLGWGGPFEIGPWHNQDSIIQGHYIWTAMANGMLEMVGRGLDNPWSDPYFPPGWVDSGESAGYFPNLLFYEDGTPVHYYTEGLGPGYRLVKSAVGEFPTFDIIHDSPGQDVGVFLDAVLGPEDVSHLAYWHSSGGLPPSGELYYATDSGALGEGMTYESTDINIEFPGSIAIAVAPDGEPCIAYVHTSGFPGPAIETIDFTCRTDGWSTPETIQEMAGIASIGLAFKRDGTPCVSYGSQLDESLKVECRGELDWSAPPVFEDLNGAHMGSGEYSDLETGPEGLMVAYSAFANCGPTTIFASEEDGWKQKNVFKFPWGDCSYAYHNVDLEVGSQPQIVARHYDDPIIMHSRRGADLDWHWTEVYETEWNNFDLGLKGDSPQIALKGFGPMPSLHRVWEVDSDHDQMMDQPYFGPDGVGLQAHISGFPVFINEVLPYNYEDLEGDYYSITAGPVSFEYGFYPNGFIDFSGISIVEGEDYTEVHMTRPVDYKFVSVNKAGGNQVCIMDYPNARIIWATGDCSGEEEMLVDCPGTSGDYTCLDDGNQWTIQTLDHSTIYVPTGEGPGPEGEGDLNPCAVLQGVICDENLACSAGQFTPAFDTNRCCIGSCISSADLAVVDVSAPEAILFKDTPTTVTVQVENVGLAAAGPFVVSLAIQEPYSTVAQKTVQGLGMGETISVDFNFDPAPYDGLKVLEAKADAAEAIPEPDEENNIGIFEVFVREREVIPEEGEDFVDLLVLNAKVSDPGAIVGEDLTVTATILNAGTLDSGAFTIGLYADSVYEPVIDAHAITTLEPLESVDVTLDLPTLGLPEKTEIIVFADDGRNVVELDEENNTGSIDLQLIGEKMTVYFARDIAVGSTQVFNVTDSKGKDLAGVTIQINYPFEDRLKAESVNTDAVGAAYFVVNTSGTHSFAATKPGFYPVYGEFEATGEGIIVPTAAGGFDLVGLVVQLVILLIVLGVIYKILVMRGILPLNKGGAKKPGKKPTKKKPKKKVVEITYEPEPTGEETA